MIRALTVAAILGVPLAACPSTPSGPGDTRADASWGPLAVIAAPDGGGQALANGTLRVTADCVTVETSEENTLLVWPADRTQWDSDRRNVLFRTSSNDWVRLKSGDRVIVGGSGSSATETGITGDEWLARMDWISEPAKSCPMNTRWSVAEVHPP